MHNHTFRKIGVFSKRTKKCMKAIKLLKGVPPGGWGGIHQR